MMLDRKLAAVGLVAILSVLVLAGARTFTTLAAPAAQFELVRGAIHAGTCRNAEQPAVATLEGFTRSGAPNDTAAPLLSTTEAPVALSDLLASPHALLVTVGGDRAALLACGEIEGATGGPTANVELSERNDSGLSGIALLLGSESVTQVSVILNVEQERGQAAPPVIGAQGTPAALASPTAEATVPAGSPTAAAASPTAQAGFPIPTPGAITGGPPATPASGEQTPTGTGDEPTATAAAGGPTIPIFLPPVAQGTPAGTEVRPTAVGTTAGTYTSQEFGYSLVIPEGWDFLRPPQVEAGLDYIQIGNGENSIDFGGVASSRNATECLDVHYDYVRGLPAVTLVLPHTGADAALTTRTPERAIEVWDVTIVGEQGQLVPLTVYADCRVLVPGQSILLTTHEAPAATYASQAPLREEVYRGLTLP